MGILGRLSTLIKSNVNDAIDSMQDPGKEIDQMVRDMDEATRDARGEVASCMVEEKRLQKRMELLGGELKSWEDRAAFAVRSGDDNLAREALARKVSVEAERAETSKALQAQAVYVDQLMSGLKALEARVKDVKLRQGTLREKARRPSGAAGWVGSAPRRSRTSSVCRTRSKRSKRRPPSETSSRAGRPPPSRPSEN